MVLQLKIGSDICSVERIMSVYEKYGQRFLRRILTEREKAYVESRSLSNDSLRSRRLSQALAARFAAKEATAKALGTGWRGIDWKEVEVVNASSGAPQINLSGRAKHLFVQLGFKNIEISLSHEHEYALAMVVMY